jgi:hypothetical protein
MSKEGRREREKHKEGGENGRNIARQSERGRRKERERDKR